MWRYTYVPFSLFLLFDNTTGMTHLKISTPNLMFLLQLDWGFCAATQNTCLVGKCLTTWFINFVSNQLWFTSWFLWSIGAHLQQYSIKLQKTVIPLWECSLTLVYISYMTCRKEIVSLSDCKSRFSFCAVLPYVCLKCWALWHILFYRYSECFLCKGCQVTRCGIQFRQFQKVQHLMVIYHMWCILRSCDCIITVSL